MRRVRVSAPLAYNSGVIVSGAETLSIWFARLASAFVEFRPRKDTVEVAEWPREVIFMCGSHRQPADDEDVCVNGAGHDGCHKHGGHDASGVPEKCLGGHLHGSFETSASTSLATKFKLGVWRERTTAMASVDPTTSHDSKT